MGLKENNKIVNIVDLHTHSVYSDGTYNVEEILNEAEKLNLALLSITDHNTVDAYYELEDKELRSKFNGKIIPGCEITTTYKGEIIEVLGYGFEYEKFREKLAENTLSERDRRLRKYKVSCLTVDTLYKRGVKFRDNFGDELYKNPRQFYDTRNEAIMDAILREIKSFPENVKYFNSIKEMLEMTTKEFVRDMIYNPKSEFYIDQSKLYPSLEKVLEIIHECGGLAFLAHLYVYSSSIEENLENIISNYNLDGCECFYTLFTDKQTEKIVKFCRYKKLYISGGSDFHGERKQNHNLGRGNGNLLVPIKIIEEWINKIKKV